MHHRLARARIRVGRASCARRSASSPRSATRSLGEPGNEPIELLVPDAAAEAEARAALAEHGARVRYRRMPYGDIWLRDTAPIFLRGPEGLGSVRFRSNGWGGKYRYPGDAELGRAARRRSSACRASRSTRVLEGGAVELDGAGHLPDHRELPAQREPRRSRRARARVEAMLREALRGRRRCSGCARGWPAITPTATSTTSRASSRPAW